MTAKSSLFVNSLAKGLSLLEVFSPDKTKLSLSDLTRATGMHQAAVQRYTHTLLSLGYLERGPDKRYSLAPRVLSLGYACLQGSDLVSRVEIYLREFAHEVGSSVNLSVLDGTHALIMFRHELRRSFFQYDIHAGTKLPIHCTSMGKLFLATLPDKELKKRIAQLDMERMTPHTITDPQQLYEEAIRVRQSGLGEADREASLDLHSMAVPLLDQGGKVIAAISVSTPVNREQDPAHERVRDLLIEQGRKLSGLMGYTGPYPVINLAEV